MGQAWRSTHRDVDQAVLTRGVALVVEPDVVKRQEAAIALRRLGYHAHETGCGAVAQFIATQIQIDVAVIDVMLPDMNAMHLVKRVRTLSPEALIVATAPTTEAWEATAGLTQHAGADLMLSAISTELIRRAVGGEHTDADAHAS